MPIDIINGNVAEVELEESGYDALLSDPTYGLGFMGKDWDRAVLSVEVLSRFYRVLKPGAPLLMFGGTRTFDILG